MKFDFNKNINEEYTMSDETYNRLLKQYSDAGQIENLKILKQRFGQNRSNTTRTNIIENPNNTNTDDSIDIIDNQLNNKLSNIISNQNISKDFRDAIIAVSTAHDKIVDLYTESLYEEDWEDSKLDEFENQMTIYNKNLDYIKNNIQNIEWNSESTKREFIKYFNEVLAADAKVWNIIQVRHFNYKRYRSNRKSIVLQLGDLIDGGLKSGKDDNDVNIFKYFNNVCANEKLYLPVEKTISKEGFSRKRQLNLSFTNWFKPKLPKITDDLKERGILNGSIDAKDIADIFKKYVKARIYAYAIFNLMTSISEFNGWDKWHNKFIDYCDANLSDPQLERLINAVDTENQFEDIDDYHNIMDEENWEQQGLYESWFDESLDYYKSHKDRYNKSKINKINMVPTNANVCRVTCDGTNVYANTTFYPGDIIEICPTKKISKDALYSKDMRDSVFEVVPNEEWVLPFGYCRYYLGDAINNEANCTYIWDPIKRVIVIKAINKIPKYSKLLLEFNL